MVPEIELPGHCGAALACYPHLSCEHPWPTYLIHPDHLVCDTAHYTWPTLCDTALYIPVWLTQQLLTAASPGRLQHGHNEQKCAGAGAKDMSQVPVQWGVHEDVFCAVRSHCFSVFSSFCPLRP